MSISGFTGVSGGFGGPSRILTSQPGIVESPAATVLSQNETVGGSLWTLSWKDHCAKADAETMGFHLHLTFHQDNLKGPTLQPAQSEGIGQKGWLGENSPYGP